MVLKKGFTLIELLIVFAIIGILAAIAIPNFMNAAVKARIAKTHSNFRTIRDALFNYNIDNHSFSLVNSSGGNQLNGFVFHHLTTPVPYLSSIRIAFDDFGTEWVIDEDVSLHLRYYDYMFSVQSFDSKKTGSQQIFNTTISQSDAFLLTSLGPDQERSYKTRIALIWNFPNAILKLHESHFKPYTYSTSNGLFSDGDLMATNSMIYQ